MKLSEIYVKAVEKGVKDDPRPSNMVVQALKDSKKEFKSLKGIEKASFDSEKLKNPYADSRILFGKGSEEIKNVLIGIDIDVQELLLADRLNEKGEKIDLVISHHPTGRAFAQLSDVLPLQPDIWENLGFTREIARGSIKNRQDEVARSISSRNHMRVVDAAKLLGIPFMCLHTVADNCVSKYLTDLFRREKPRKVKDVRRLLDRIPEYRHYRKTTGIGPQVLVGDAKDEAGKIFVDMTGGTNGPDNVLARLSQSGVKTIVGMHIKESGFKTVKSEFLNYVVAGHIASDNLGVNLLLDHIDKKKQLKIYECSGFKRVKR